MVTANEILRHIGCVGTVLYFQQNGAPANYAQTVTEYLHQAFPQRWLGRRGSIEWPPHSPATNGSISWGAVKNNVYERNLHIVNELKDYISDAFKEID